MKRGAWLFLFASTAGCGGQELLIDATPPTLIPNGGSAQAGQVEGPTAIPLTGMGAIAQSRDTEPTPAAAPPAPPSVMDLAALEANGATALATDADGDDDGASDGTDDDDDDEKVAGDRAPAAAVSAGTTPAEPPAPPSVASIPPDVSSAVRTIGGPGYALAIPADWEDLDPGGLGSFLITSANRSMDPGVGFYTNVIVSAEPFPGDTPSYATLNAPSLIEAGALLRDSSTVAPTKRDRGRVDVEAYWINVTGAPYITLQRYVTTGTVGYVITCAAAASAFEEERQTCVDILDSIRVEAAAPAR